MKNILRRLSVPLLAVAILLFAGCTYRYTVPEVSLRDQGNEFAVSEKIDLAVNLCVTNDLKATTWSKDRAGETLIIHIGDQLAKNSVELADILFKETVVTSIPGGGGSKQIDAILTPKVVVLERTLGVTAFDETVFTIVLEWKLEDTQHNVIWVDSIKGEGRAPVGGFLSSRDSKGKEQMTMLLKDLFGESLKAMKMSREISQFARNKSAASSSPPRGFW